MRRSPCPLRLRIVAGVTGAAFTLVFVFPGCGPPPPTAKRPADRPAAPAAAQTQQAVAQTPQQLDAQIERMQQAVDSVDKTAFDVPALAASLGPDPEKLFGFVRDEVAYEVYRGSLRGAKGALIGRAANSVDKSLLLAELLRANHFTVQFASCTLDEQSAQSLVDQMTLPGPTRPSQGADDTTLQSLEAGHEVETEQAAGYRAIRQHMDGIAQQSVKDGDAILQLLTDSHIALGPDAQQNRQDLVSEARQHTWVQYRQGDAWIDLDPSRLGQKSGERIAPPVSAVSDLPASLAWKVAMRVRVERRAHGALSQWTALESVQTAADLAGAGISFANAPGGIGQDGTLAAARKATRFMPELVIRGTTISRTGFDLQGNPIPASVFAAQPNATAGGFAAASGALGALGGDPAPPAAAPTPAAADGMLTGEWLEVEVSGPGAPAKTYVREIVDRIGIENRSPAHAIAIKAELRDPGRVAMALIGQRSILIEPGFSNEQYVENILTSQILAKKALLHTAFAEKLANTPTGQTAAKFADSFKSEISPELSSLSAGIRAFGAQEAEGRFRGAVFYHASPAIFIYETTVGPRADGAIVERRGFDIVDNSLRVLAPVGSPAAPQLALSIGVYQTHLERALALDFARLIQEQVAAETTAQSEIGSVSSPWSAIDVFAAAGSAQVPAAIAGGPGASGLAALDLPAGARARIANDVAHGSLVISPQRAVALDGQQAVGWWRIDRRTGNTLGVMDTGKGQGATETAVLEGNTVNRTEAALRFAQSLCIVTGYLFKALLYVSLLLLVTRIASNPAAAPQQIAKFLKDFLSLGNLLLIVGTGVACRRVNLKLEAFSEGEPGGAPKTGPSEKPGKGGEGPEKPGAGPDKPGAGPDKPGKDAKTPEPKPGEQTPNGPARRSKIREAGLPANGRVRYVPPKGWKPSMPLPKAPGGGFIDAAGRVWKKGPNHHFPDEIDPDTGQPWSYEWDIQPPRGAPTFPGGVTHKNVSPNGTIR